MQPGVERDAATDQHANNLEAAKPPAGWQKLLVLGHEALQLIKNLIELAGLELLVALRAIPKLIAISFGLIFIFSLTWISFSVCLSWLAYRVVGDAGAGFFCFFLIQLIALGVLGLAFRRYQRHLSLPHSRAQYNDIAEVIRDALTASVAKKDAGDK